MTAVERWASELAAWAIDPEILAAAPESPYGFPPGLFGADRGTPATVAAARAAGPRSVLDVGCGGGAASIPVGAAELLAVDESAELLERYRAAAGAMPVRTWRGRWPDVAGEVPAADVAVAANVVYNVPDIAEFLVALTDHARRRVVVELTDAHPWTSLAGLWRHFHGQDRPSGPTAELFGEVLAELGLAAESVIEPRTDPWREAPEDVVVAFTRRRLCLPVSREPEVAEAMRRFRDDRPRTATVFWWAGTA
ncbi:MAG TPA: class I SAM-dependent methyltransferase [Geodermatophilus sp.]|nr:class I SAM-dependent methyltransferase [Geodermatophilus sp.]